MTVKATVFRQNLFRYMEECYSSGSPLIIERGRERFVLKPQGSRRPVGSIPSRPWIAPDLDKLPGFSPADDLVYSPMARLELDFLYEIGRIKEDPRAIMALLAQDHGVLVETEGWVRAPEIAATLGWTRDTFDRLITAHALTWAAPLLTRDGTIRDNYRHAFWDKLPAY